jgi:hypothetical protein
VTRDESRRDALLSPAQRWAFPRKLRLCAGLAAGLITRAEVKRAHGLTDQEIDAWMAAYVRGGAAEMRIYAPRPWRAAALVRPVIHKGCT